MKATFLLSALLGAALSMTSMPASAQREFHMRDDGSLEMRGHDNRRNDRYDNRRHDDRDHRHNNGRGNAYGHDKRCDDRRYRDPYAYTPRHHHYRPAVRPGRWDHRFAPDGYLPGYVGRVRYVDGRYGYLRGSNWYWYDTYFEPTYYYSRPVRHFRRHALSPAARGAIGGAIAGAVIGGIVSAVAY